MMTHNHCARATIRCKPPKINVGGSTHNCSLRAAARNSTSSCQGCTTEVFLKSNTSPTLTGRAATEHSQRSDSIGRVMPRGREHVWSRAATAHALQIAGLPHVDPEAMHTFLLLCKVPLVKTIRLFQKTVKLHRKAHKRHYPKNCIVA